MILALYNTSFIVDIIKSKFYTIRIKCLNFIFTIKT